MILYNNQEYKNFKELREKCHLVSERYIRIVCHCRTSFTEKICKENNIKKYVVTALGKECEVFSDEVIELINKVKPQGSDTIPENYITRKELADYLGVKLSALSDIEFWCWEFRNYRKSITVKGSLKTCYEFTPKAKEFYDRKIYKWRHPDRKNGTCWQR